MIVMVIRRERKNCLITQTAKDLLLQASILQNSRIALILQTDPVVYLKFVARVVRQRKRQGDLIHVQILAWDHVLQKQTRMFEKHHKKNVNETPPA